jgi:hypothetical protein
MSKRSRRTLTGLVRASGAFMETHQTEFGMFQEFYAGIPIGVSDYIPDNETQGSSNNASRIYALKFGEGSVSGLQAPAASRWRRSAPGDEGRHPLADQVVRRPGDLPTWRRRTERRAAVAGTRRGNGQWAIGSRGGYEHGGCSGVTRRGLVGCPSA